MKDRIQTLIFQLNAEIAKEGDSGLCFVAPELLREVISMLTQSADEIKRLQDKIDFE
jgi:hypothetical protein